MAYGPKGKSTSRMKSPKGFSKKAAKKVAASRNKPVSKRFGKPVMKADEREPGRKMGYATVAKTKLPDYSPKKLTTAKGRKATRKASKR